VLIPAKLRVPLAVCAVAAGALAAAVLGTAGPAVGQSSPPMQGQIQVNSPATLMAKGASVNVSVTASCSGATQPGGLTLEVSQRVAGKIAFGFAEGSINCTGTSQTTDLLVIAGSESPSGLPQGPSKAFAKGTALTTASIDACDFVSCVSQQVNATIKITK
jgi:hypothetical protein